MRIVFYSASTSAHSNSSTKTTYQPFRADTWDEMDRLYPDCEFVVAGPLNGSYIFDVADGEICKKPEKVKYVLLESGMSAEDTAELIAQQRPDIAVAIASGAVPFDWVPIKTALIAEELQKRGIATIANNTLVSVAAFDKWRSNIMFRSFVKAAKGIYIHHELFLAEKKNPGVSVNVMISHQERIIRMADRIMVITDGKVESIGAADEIMPKLFNQEVDSCECRRQKGGELYGA